MEDEDKELIRRRLMALDNVSMISCKLLAKNNFPKVVKAIENKDIDLFSQICKDAKIPEKAAKVLTSMFELYSASDMEWAIWPPVVW